MIHFISHYFYEMRRDKVHMLEKAERRRAFLMLCAIAVCVGISIFLWLR